MRGRAFALRLILLLFSMAIFLATGELALRIIYRDAGKRTLGGPGGRTFEHLTIRDEQRGRFDAGPKTPGKPRIMILGDSITWGQGVRNWEDTWPELLARALDASGRPHDLAVLALPGRDIPAHVEEMRAWAGELRPDVFIYQWYVNDIEVSSERPRNVHVWQRWPMHDALRQWSYLYYFVDNRLATYLPPPDRSYVDYILQDFVPGSLEWAEFERYFHELATRAKEVAPARLLVVYPQVPFKGTAPLQPVYERVAALASPHRLSIPPAAWVRFAGSAISRADARWHQALQVPPALTGPVFETRDYYLPAGDVQLTLTTLVDGDAAAGPRASIDMIDAESAQVIASAPVIVPDRAGWQEVAVRPTLPAHGGLVRFRLSSAGGGGFLVGSLELPVDYGFRVLDLTEPLNTFNTHASIFDAHPNERAHKVIAEKVLEAIGQLESRH